MIQPNLSEKLILRELQDGLILRRAEPRDAEALADFNAHIHSDFGPDQPDLRIRAWTHDLLARPHPTFSPGDFTIVEEGQTGKIVSSLSLISQTWSYEGVLFKVGRPELVGTLPEYRNRGLVRLQFDVVHGWSAERGQVVQVITGIPYYYRLFRYEMGLELGGGKAGYKPNLPVLKEGEKEPYNIRTAVAADIPFLSQVYRYGCERSLVACERTDEIWRYELTGKSLASEGRVEVRLIETWQGEPVGFFTYYSQLNNSVVISALFECKPGCSWVTVTPCVARYLYSSGEKIAESSGQKDRFAGLGFWLGREHPVYQVMGGRLPQTRKPYAFFVRVPDLAGFIRQIAPVLERRLKASAFNGYTGELTLTFYRDGLRLGFENGRLAVAEKWKPAPEAHSGDANFPELTFLQLLFGYRSLDELRYAFADCLVDELDKPEVPALLNTLFPKHYSHVWPLA